MRKSFLVKKQHIIDYLFPLSLFLALTLCAAIILLYASSIYQKAVSTSATADNGKTALSYITQKIHQGDENGNVYLQVRGSAGEDHTELPDGIDTALVLESENAGDSYATYIYYYNGSLCELLTRVGSPVGASAGTKILSVSDLQIEQISDGLYRFTCTDNDGQSESALVSVRSSTEESEESEETDDAEDLAAAEESAASVAR